MEHFTEVITSPRPSPRGQLTGNPRVVKDLAAEIHSCIQEWNRIHIHGVSLLKNITKIKVDETFPEELVKLCDDLAKDVDQLEEIVSQLGVAARKLRAVTELNKGKDNLFTTAPTEFFENTANFIYNSYKKELEVKRVVLENVAHEYRDSFKMVHLAAWVYQPMIPHDLNVSLEAMLVETGHRTINE